MEEDKGDISEEVREDEDELHAWCLLEESEKEQWQDVISKVEDESRSNKQTYCELSDDTR